MLGIMAGMYQKDSSALVFFWQWHVLCWFGWLRCTSRFVPFWRRQAQDALHHGRYGPEGQYSSCARRHSWQWHVHSWFFSGYAALRAVSFVVVRPRCSASWPVWTSLTVTQWAGVACYNAPRAVFFSGSQAHDAPHHGWDAQDRQLPEAYRKIGLLGEYVVFFNGPLYLEVTCSSYLPEEYRVASFPGDDSRNGFRIQHSSWFNSGYLFGISLRGLLEEFHAFLREGRTLGSCV